jgi:hypothetical protein
MKEGRLPLKAKERLLHSSQARPLFRHSRFAAKLESSLRSPFVKWT